VASRQSVLFSIDVFKQLGGFGFWTILMGIIIKPSC
jgi:hypothetical protein